MDTTMYYLRSRPEGENASSKDEPQLVAYTTYPKYHVTFMSVVSQKRDLYGTNTLPGERSTYTYVPQSMRVTYVRR